MFGPSGYTAPFTPKDTPEIAGSRADGVHAIKDSFHFFHFWCLIFPNVQWQHILILDKGWETLLRIMGHFNFSITSFEGPYCLLNYRYSTSLSKVTAGNCSSLARLVFQVQLLSRTFTKCLKTFCILTRIFQCHHSRHLKMHSVCTLNNFTLSGAHNFAAAKPPWTTSVIFSDILFYFWVVCIHELSHRV